MKTTTKKTTTKKTKAGAPEVEAETTAPVVEEAQETAPEVQEAPKVEATPEGVNEGVKAPGKVDVLDKAGNVIRTYSYEEHGPKFVELATSFAHKDSTRSLHG